MTDGEVTERWRTPTGSTLAEEVVRRLLAGDPLDDLNLNKIDGLVDLRGLPATSVGNNGATGWAIASDLSWELLDLSWSDVSGWRFRNCIFRRCLFDSADCRDWRVWESRVEDCSFRQAALTGAVVGARNQQRPNLWRKVDFTGADFRVDASQEARYEECNFSGANLEGVRFEQCHLNRLTFGGAMVDVMFDGRAMDDRPSPPPLEQLNLTAAQVNFVAFLGYRLDGLMLPADRDLRLIHRFPEVLRQAVTMLTDDSETTNRLREQFKGRLEIMRVGSNPDDDDLFNRRDYLAIGGSDLANLAEETIARAESALRA
jgi:uncharacterized protein YjbI with pentapeptide repeats